MFKNESKNPSIHFSLQCIITFVDFDYMNNYIFCFVLHLHIYVNVRNRRKNKQLFKQKSIKTIKTYHKNNKHYLEQNY